MRRWQLAALLLATAALAAEQSCPAGYASTAQTWLFSTMSALPTDWTTALGDGAPTGGLATPSISVQSGTGVVIGGASWSGAANTYGINIHMASSPGPWKPPAKTGEPALVAEVVYVPAFAKDRDDDGPGQNLVNFYRDLKWPIGLYMHAGNKLGMRSGLELGPSDNIPSDQTCLMPDDENFAPESKHGFTAISQYNVSGIAGPDNKAVAVDQNDKRWGAVWTAAANSALPFSTFRARLSFDHQTTSSIVLAIDNAASASSSPAPFVTWVAQPSPTAWPDRVASPLAFRAGFGVGGSSFPAMAMTIQAITISGCSSGTAIKVVTADAAGKVKNGSGGGGPFTTTSTVWAGAYRYDARDVPTSLAWFGMTTAYLLVLLSALL